MNAKILEADKKLASREDINNDAALVCFANSRWETLLCPAPLGIAILGDLMIVASSTAGFSLKVHEKSYKYLENPDSFQASLVQISNAGYQAFNKAHTNMDKIRLYSMNVPNHMKDVTKILMCNDPQVVSRFLKIPLNRIDEASKECLKLSKEVVECFDGVLNVTTELVKACSNTKAVSEEEKKNSSDRLETAQDKKAAYEKLMEEKKSEKKKLEDEIDSACSDLRTQVDSMPSGKVLLVVTALENISNVLTQNIFPPMLRYAPAIISSVSSACMANQTTGREKEERRTRQAPNISSVVKLGVIVSQLEKLLSNGFEKLNKADKECFNPVGHIDQIKKIEKNAHECEELKKLCKSVLEVLEKMAKLATEKISDDDNHELKSQIETLAEAFDVMKSQAQVPLLPIESQSPAAVNLMKNIGKSGSVAQMMQEKAKFKVSIALDSLEYSRAQAAKLREEINEVNSKYLKSLEEMQKFRASKIHYDEVIELLTRGLQTLGTLKEHWVKLVHFFESVSNIVEVVMNKELNDFNKYVAEASPDTALNEFMLDMIYNSAIKVNQASFVIHSMANVYVKVSDSYIMNNLFKLDQLMAFVPSTGESINDKRNELFENCKKDLKAITEFVMSERTKIAERIETRMQQLEEGYAFLKVADKPAEGDEDVQTKPNILQI